MYDLRQQVDNFGQFAIEGQAGQKSAFSMACRLWRNSAELSEVLSAMNYYNSTKCVPKFSGAELNRIVDSAYKHTAAAGDVAKFRKEHGGAVLSLSDKSDLPIPSIGVTPNGDHNDRSGAITACHDLLLQNSTPSNRLKKYLSGRGITTREIGRFGLGLSLGDPLPRWLTIPLVDVMGRCQGVMIKTFSDGGAKYIKLGGSCLFGAYHRSAAENVLIVEGQLDAILLSRYTDYAVVTVGSVNHGIDSDGLKWLQSRKRVLIAMDHDLAGGDGCEKWRRLLPVAMVATPCPIGKDATDVYTHGGSAAVKKWLSQNDIALI